MFLGKHSCANISGCLRMEDLFRLLVWGYGPSWWEGLAAGTWESLHPQWESWERWRLGFYWLPPFAPLIQSETLSPGMVLFAFRVSLLFSLNPLWKCPLCYTQRCVFYVMLSPFNLIIYADNGCGYSMTWREGHSDQPPSGIFSEQAVEGGTMPDEPLWGVSTFKYAQDMLTKRSSLPERNDPSGLNGHLSMSSSEFSYVKEEKLF